MDETRFYYSEKAEIDLTKAELGFQLKKRSIEGCISEWNL